MSAEVSALKEEAKRVLKEVRKTLKSRMTETIVSKDQLKKLFFYKNLDTYVLSAKEYSFYEWVKEEYNTQIKTFIRLSEKEKEASNLFFIAALQEFKNKIKMELEIK